MFGCYFAQEINSATPCAFDIPNIVKEYKTIDNRNNYYVIQNYSCRYGFSKKTYSENIDKFNEIDMVKYVKEQNIVKYSLALILDKKYSYDQLINDINQLSIKPQYITIICFDKGPELYKLLKFRPNVVGLLRISASQALAAFRGVGGEGQGLPPLPLFSVAQWHPSEMKSCGEESRDGEN